MYTMCWTDIEGNSRWDRFHDRRSLMAAIIQNHLEDDEDILIFGPVADDCLMTVEDIAIAL